MMRETDQGQVLCLNSVHKTYVRSHRPALDHVSFSVAPGEFFSILGPSGSGKTTILRTVAGFEKPDRGSVLMAGEDVTHVPPNRRDVRTVFQSYALFPHMTVLENIQFPLQMQGVAKEARAARASEALELVAMGSYASRFPNELSGGERQRVALARAIVSRPKILLLDEPLGALDLRLRQQMQHTLVSLQHELKMAFVYVTHDQGEALSMSDRVLVMREGQIAQIGKPQDLYFEPQSEFVAKFVGNSNMLPVDFVADGKGYVATIGGVRFPSMRGKQARQAKLAIRYDDVTLSVEKKPMTSDGLLHGVVENALFLGTNVEVNVRCGDLEIMSSMPSARTAQLVSGQPVTISFNLARAQVFNV